MAESGRQSHQPLLRFGLSNRLPIRLRIQPLSLLQIIRRCPHRSRLCCRMQIRPRIRLQIRLQIRRLSGPHRRRSRPLNPRNHPPMIRREIQPPIRQRHKKETPSNDPTEPTSTTSKVNPFSVFSITSTHSNSNISGQRALQLRCRRLQRAQVRA